MRMIRILSEWPCRRDRFGNGTGQTVNSDHWKWRTSLSSSGHISRIEPLMTMPAQPAATLDPTDWQALRQQGHQMLDDMLDYIQKQGQGPVWRPIAQQLRQQYRQSLPKQGQALEQVHERFLNEIQPYAVGNSHPAFMGWVHGAGTPVGMLAEMLAAGLNANLGGRDQMPLEVERQITHWMRELFGFPSSANGVFVTGSSMANFMGVLCARTRALGPDACTQGVAQHARPLTAYAAASAHSCVAKAMNMSGLGTQALRLVRLNSARQMDVAALQQMIRADRLAGSQPFLIVATAGSVDTGAIDDLAALRGVAQSEGLWLHVDAALGGLGLLAPDVAPQLQGISEADSVALDFHKWGQVPYDAGYFLARQEADLTQTFSMPAAYLSRHQRGLAAGFPWPCDLGPDLSRSFRALKTWFTFMVHGTDKMGAAISRSCALARYLAQRVNSEPELELLAPVNLNIVCFRYRCPSANATNSAIVADLHESGIAVPSLTELDGKTAIRAALVNHRTRSADVDALLNGVLHFGRLRNPAAVRALAA